MTSEQASRLVIASLIVVSVVSIFGEIGKGKTPAPRLFIAGGALYMMLALLSDFAPQIAGPLAVLITIGVVIQNGEPAIAGFSKRIGGKK